MKESNNNYNNRDGNKLIGINPESSSNDDIGKSDTGKKILSNWQMYQLAISSVVFIKMTEEDLYSVIPTDQAQTDFQFFANLYNLGASSSNLYFEQAYSYEAIFRSRQSFVSLWLNERDRTFYEKNEFIRNCLYKIRMVAKYLHRVLQIIVDYDYYFFVQGPASLSLHFDALETFADKNTITGDFFRDGLREYEGYKEKKRIASRYQTLSFYDYSYFYEDKEPDETAVDFWLAMDRYLEELYLTRKNIRENNSDLDNNKLQEKYLENANNKDRLRNYVHRIMIVPDELLSDDEKKFREWVRKTENQKKFVEVYKKTFNRVEKTGLKKIEGNIEKQKETIGSKLLFCKQKITFQNLEGKEETKFVYSLKLLRDEQWVEYPNDKHEKYSNVPVYNTEHRRYDTKKLQYKLNDEEESYEFPNMEYLTYLLHANPQELNEIEKEFVDAFLDRGFDAYPSGRFSLGVQMHLEDVKQYVHDNLITGREKWKLEENGLSDTDIFNILGSDKRINAFNQKFEKIYNADLVKNLWDEAQEELKAKDKINNFDAPTDAPEQYDIAKEMYNTLKICNKKEIKDKNKLPVTINQKFEKIYNADLVKNLWDEAQEELKESNNSDGNKLIGINPKSSSNNAIGKNDTGKKTLSDWQMYQLAISSLAFATTLKGNLYIPISSAENFHHLEIFYSLSSKPYSLCCEESYSYEFIFRSGQAWVTLRPGADTDPNNYENNKFIRNYLHKIRMVAKYLHHMFQIVVDYDYYFFNLTSTSLSLHFDNLAFDTTEFYRDGLLEHTDKKRIASRYQTLSFYDYSYFYEDKEPDETAVDFWLAMDRYLEEAYLTSKNIKENSSNLDNNKLQEKYLENVNNKDKLRNYVHKIMIVPDELLNDNEKKFCAWVRDPENQKKFVEIYKKTFNRVKETGLKKIEGNIEEQKKTIESKLLFCKQKITFQNLEGGKETKFVYSLKLLRDKQWIEYPNNKHKKYSEVDVYNTKYNRYVTKELKYELNNEEELYEFPNMEYLTYLLHADPNKLSEIEKEFVDAFLDRSLYKAHSGRFSLGVQMHLEDVKQYVHDNLITGRENWKLKENGLSDKDMDILNILNDDGRINEFNKSVDEIYNADLVKNLWDEAQKEYESRFDFDWLKFRKFLAVALVFSVIIFLALKFTFDVIVLWALITFPIAPILIFLVYTFVFRNKFCLINRYFDAPTDAPEQYDIAKEMYNTLQICNKKEIKDKNKLPVTITFNCPKFFKGLLVALGVSLAIFLALKFIFDVVAIWSLIIFPVVPVIIFFVCVFSFKDKFEKITYPSKIKALISNNKNLIEQENQLNLKLDEMKMNEIITEKKK